MPVNESIKTLLIKENMTLTDLAQNASLKSGKKVTMDGLSRKLKKQTMKYNEAEFLAEVLGYKIIFEKIIINK